MTNIFESGIQSLIGILQSTAGTPATYNTGSATFTITVAMATSSKNDISTKDELHLVADERDFIVAKSELPTVTPEPRHTITVNGQTWQVNKLGNETCWRYSDPFNALMRIHTRKL